MSLAQALVPAETGLRVDIHGNGRVSRALRALLPQAGIAAATVHDSKGVVERHATDGGCHVLVDVTTPRYGGPRALHWGRFLCDRLRSGVTVVTANKAPLAQSWDRLQNAAREGGAEIRFTATVGGGTPVLPTLSRLLASHGVRRIEASLSGTLSYVVERLCEGKRLAEAVWEAQEAGYAEPDPVLDLDGTDVLAKAHILHHVAFPDAAAPRFELGRGPLQLGEARVRALFENGAAPQVIATVGPGTVRVALERLARLDPLAARPGEAAVRITTGDGRQVVLSGPGAGPETTARAVLGDLLGLRSGRSGDGLLTQ